MTVYSCPACKNQEASGIPRCKKCGADLTLLQQLDSLPDVWFNNALELAAQGKRLEAIEAISTCCALRPTDVEAHVVKAQLLGQIGHRKKARAVLAIAHRLGPVSTQLTELEEALAK